ncbi:dTDP-glucose 4,6-dehydratase [Limibaculum sp. FT325]|uniref:dTDP-glucose 4,6-dehydratase n=1 Tax=Thermohalobaculum sediminis TaxID=2939436 RepID=UPI0020BFC977|nr:dTDP-glucose 4,6-dehydratase [Limibaculum sediminis]MCL5778967.1 dTDP-glucose 4,6-dehydratase [Limibaculum sediminis]
MRILVTGGAGFIGSAFIRRLIRETDADIVNLDKLTYAATPDALGEAAESPRYRFVRGDICDRPLVDALIEETTPDAVVHLAAESHVDRSIDGPAAFLETNVHGTFTLLEAVRRWRAGRRNEFRFHHVSTDEVYGSLGPDEPAFTEDSPYRPNSPYAASKAASDHLVRSWGETYGLPVIVTNTSNNYGPWQFPEKLIPVMVIAARLGHPMLVYGAGENVRDWLHVSDHAAALWRVLTRGTPGRSYNIGGNSERRNIDLVRHIAAIMDRLNPGGAPHDRLITFVADRPGHDKRYAINGDRIYRELGWRPELTFEEGLDSTIAWYLEHETWWRAIRERRYGGERLGVLGS